MLKSFQYKKNEYNNIPLLLVLLGKDHHQEPVYRVHGVPIYQFFYCKNGQGEVIIDNRKYVIDKGQCFVILKDTPHEYHSTSDDWILDIIGFNGNIVPLLLRTLKMNQSGAYLLSGRDLLSTHYDKLIEISNQTIPRKHMILSQELYGFLTDLANSLTHIVSGVADYGNPTITRVIEYMESNYSEDIPLDTLASLVSRTPEYLCSIFKEHTGVTVGKYLANIRMLHATILLVQEPSLPINQVAQACGFRSPSYFGKQFLSKYGVTPNQYRMNHMI